MWGKATGSNPVTPMHRDRIAIRRSIAVISLQGSHLQCAGRFDLCANIERKVWTYSDHATGFKLLAVERLAGLVFPLISR